MKIYTGYGGVAANKRALMGHVMLNDNRRKDTSDAGATDLGIASGK